MLRRRRRRGHSYDVAGAGRGRLTRGGLNDGEFRRIDSVARRGGTKLLLRSSGSIEEERSDGRRGSDGLLAQRLEVPAESLQQRRRSSPNIWMLEERVGVKPRPHSTYLELLEEVTSELNLGEQKREEEENIVESAFSFLEDQSSGSEEVMR